MDWRKISAAERHHYWSTATPAEIRFYVDQEGRALFRPAINAAWHYIQFYPISRLKQWVVNHTRWSADSWRKWYQTEHDSDASYYDKLERDYVADQLNVNPAIIAEYPDGFDIGDGWHRIGIAYKYNLRYIPAIVAKRNSR